MKHRRTKQIWYVYVNKFGDADYVGHIYMRHGSTVDDLIIATSHEYSKRTNSASFKAFADHESWQCNYALPRTFRVEGLKTNLRHAVQIADVSDRDEHRFSEELFLNAVEEHLGNVAERLAALYKYPHNPHGKYTIADVLKVHDDDSRENWDYVRYSSDDYVFEDDDECPVAKRKGDPIARVSLPENFDRVGWNHIIKMNTIVETRSVPLNRDSAINDLKRLSRLGSQNLGL